MELPVQRLDPRAQLPVRAHPGDAGFDLVAIEPQTLKPGERASIGTGIAIALPDGWGALVVPRSGLAAKHGIGVVNGPGLIDAGYRGEIRVLLINHDPSEPFHIEPGDRIAQLVLVAVPDVRVVDVEELPGSARGEGGFGSTGR
jgi:dUTP pyrophosphatase